MKIAMPINENDINSTICPSFGRAPYFLIYDNSVEEYKIMENTAAQSAGGAGIKASQLLIDQNVSIIIGPRYGENAAKLIKEAGIIFYKYVDGNALNNLKALKDNRLSEVTEAHPGFHHHGN